MSDLLKKIDLKTVVIAGVVLLGLYLIFRKKDESAPAASVKPTQVTIPISVPISANEKKVEMHNIDHPVETFNDIKQEEEGNPVVLEKNMAKEEINIKPTYMDTDVRSLMSGSGFMPQKDIIPPWGMNVEKEGEGGNVGTIDGLDDGEGGSMGFHYNLTSPACCSEQWPVPFKLPYDNFICENKDKFVASNYMGNNSWQNSGCVCMTKKQHEHLRNRGGNA